MDLEIETRREQKEEYTNDATASCLLKARDTARPPSRLAVSLSNGCDGRTRRTLKEACANAPLEVLTRDAAAPGIVPYKIGERKGWAWTSLPYNGLIVTWPEIQRLAEERQRATPVHRRLAMRFTIALS